MTNTDKATPRPWKVECLSPNNVWINSVADDRGPMPLARTLNGKADVYDAELIVRAVNNFDALLEALKELTLAIECNIDGKPDSVCIQYIADELEEAKKAIAQAEGK